MPAPPLHRHGRYEMRTVQTWVPGYSERVWVPEDCRYHPRRNRTRCRGGYYSEQWVEGHYEQRPEWVWVAPPAPGVRVRVQARL